MIFPGLTAATFAFTLPLAACEATQHYFDVTPAEELIACMNPDFIDMRAADQSSVLHLAIHASTDPEVIDAIYDTVPSDDWRAFKEFQTAANLTALHVAAKYADDPRLLTRLLAYEADVNAVIDLDSNRFNPLRGKRGTTALHFAAERVDGAPFVTALLAGGTDPTWQKTHTWETALYLAAGVAENNDVLAALMAGATKDHAINTANVRDNTPLMVALSRDRPIAVIRFLLAHGADANTRNDGDTTPLHFAVSSASDPNVVSLIFDASEKPCIADEKNRTAQQILDLPTSPLNRDKKLARRFHETCVEAAR